MHYRTYLGWRKLITFPYRVTFFCSITYIGPVPFSFGTAVVLLLSPVRARQASWSTWLQDWAIAASVSTITSTRTSRSTRAPMPPTGMGSFLSRRWVCLSKPPRFFFGHDFFFSWTKQYLHTVSFFRHCIVTRDTQPPTMLLQSPPRLHESWVTPPSNVRVGSPCAIFLGSNLPVPLGVSPDSQTRVE